MARQAPSHFELAVSDAAKLPLKKHRFVKHLCNRNCLRPISFTVFFSMSHLGYPNDRPRSGFCARRTTTNRDGSAHASNNLPVLLAGGGYKHKGHVAFDPKKNYPLSNLFVRRLQKMNVPTERFGTSTGALTELG
jgi:hypothetical protein